MTSMIHRQADAARDLPSVQACLDRELLELLAAVSAMNARVDKIEVERERAASTLTVAAQRAELMNGSLGRRLLLLEALPPGPTAHHVGDAGNHRADTATSFLWVVVLVIAVIGIALAGWALRPSPPPQRPATVGAVRPAAGGPLRATPATAAATLPPTGFELYAADPSARPKR